MRQFRYGDFVNTSSPHSVEGASGPFQRSRSERSGALVMPPIPSGFDFRIRGLQANEMNSWLSNPFGCHPCYHTAVHKLCAGCGFGRGLGFVRSAVQASARSPISNMIMKQIRMLAVGMLPPPFGGQAIMFQRAVEGLRPNYDLTVIDTQFQKNVGEAGSISVRKVLHFCGLLLGEVAPLVVAKKFDILYYCVSGPSTPGLIKDLIFLSLLRSRARKTVYHFHGAGGIAFLLRSNAVLRAWGRLVLFEPDLVLRPGSTADNSGLCKAKRDIVVDNGIEDPATIISETVQKWPAVEPSFAFIGVVTEGKGVFELVEIARFLRHRGYRFTLSIVGEGMPEEVARLKRLIWRYHLEEFVRLTGVLIGEQKLKLLRETTAFLFPSYYQAECQPTAIMEALALGVPAVAYDWRGINTIIDDGVNGYLVPLRDVDAFCRAIEKILTDKNIDRMRDAARRSYLERFTLDRHIDSLLLAFQSLDLEK